jgi:HAD superfamily hydrolase (TIGR01484 family)
MKKVLCFDLDNTLNLAKTPADPAMATICRDLLDHYEFAVISGQKFDQFIIQIVQPIIDAGATPEQLRHLHLFVTQGTRYYNYDADKQDWNLVYKYDLTDQQVAEMTAATEKAARELGFWEEDKLADGDEIIENRISQVTFSALGQKASVDAKLAWDPDMTKRNAIAIRAKELAPAYDFEVGGTTSINVTLPGTNKQFGMNHLMEELKVSMDEVLYFGDMTQPGGNDYPVVEMGFDTITVDKWQDTAFALRGILGVA